MGFRAAQQARVKEKRARSSDVVVGEGDGTRLVYGFISMSDEEGRRVVVSIMCDVVQGGCGGVERERYVLKWC